MKIGEINSFNFKLHKNNNKVQKNYNTYLNNPMSDSFELKNNNISFGSIGLNSQYKTKFRACKRLFTPESEQLFKEAKIIAQKVHANEIKEEHIFLACLIQLKNFFKELDDGAEYDSYPNFHLPGAIERTTIPGAVADKTKRKKIEPIIDKYIKIIKKEIVSQQKNSKQSYNPFMGLSKTFIQSIISMCEYVVSYTETEVNSIDDAFIFGSLSLSRNKRFASIIRNFRNELLDELKTDKDQKNQKFNLNFYNEKADKLWKNLDLGNDMFIIYDEENNNSAKHLLDSFRNLISKEDANYKNLNKDNTKIITINNDADFDYINEKVEKAKKDKNKTYIFVIPFMEVSKNTALERKTDIIALMDEDLKTIQNKPDTDGTKNIRIVFISNKDNYYLNAGKTLKESLNNYGLISLPIVNVNDAKEMLTEDKAKEYIENKTGKSFEKEAIEKAIEIANSMNGYYPEKAIQLMVNISSYYIGKEKITAQDVLNYIEETRDISKTNNGESEFKIAFNTGKTLDDIVGSPMTKAEAQSVVDQIKHKTSGTKGMTVFLDNGTSYGGGRHHTIEAIAGEAEVPMITINARDFALKDIDALSQNASLSELKIKKLVSLAKTQAETNKNNTAIIFIENFDNFASDPIYGLSSIYEQKAFSQLLREMENIRKTKGINIIIVGSVNRPELLDEDIMKPYKFLDKIIIYSPQDSKDRIDILNYYIKKENIKIAGETKEQQEKIIQNVADTTSHFSVVDLMYLLDKAKAIAKENGKDAIDRADFTEAFLQTTTGRVSTRTEFDHDKKIVASHECGHALTLSVMYNLAKKAEKPWHLPDKVNFITLDPRGDYGGSMYPKDSDNHEYSFEKIFANLICYFGGNSCEKEFYNMEGSWGITGDMQMATNVARIAVEIMGLGPKTGKFSIERNAFGVADVSDRIKNNIYDDMETMLKNANLISDIIVQTYSSFIQEFTDKYSPKVGSGECIIPSDEFEKMLDDWKERQTPDKIRELNILDKEILSIIEKTKKGELA